MNVVKTAKALIERLQKMGLNKFRLVYSTTPYGQSSYIIFDNPDEGERPLFKIRVSDHPVENIDRYLGEIHILEETSEGRIEYELSRIERHFYPDRYYEVRHENLPRNRPVEVFEVEIEQLKASGVKFGIISKRTTRSGDIMYAIDHHDRTIIEVKRKP